MVGGPNRILREDSGGGPEGGMILFKEEAERGGSMGDPQYLQFPNAVALNAVGRRNTHKNIMSAKERQRKSAKERKF